MNKYVADIHIHLGKHHHIDRLRCVRVLRSLIFKKAVPLDYLRRAMESEQTQEAASMTNPKEFLVEDDLEESWLAVANA